MKFIPIFTPRHAITYTNLDGKNEDGETALIQAIKKKYSKTIDALLEKGASKLILLVQGELKKSLLL